MFKALLTALGLAPKTLDQARGTLTEAKTFAENVNALFAAASLNLETFLSAGPDSLKLHLAGLDQAAEVTRLGGEVATLTSDKGTLAANLKTALEERDAFAAIFTSIGFDPKAKDKDGKAQDPKTAFEGFVSKRVTLDLAKTGHPPAHVPSAAEPEATAPKTAESIFAEYQKMEAGELKQAFYAKNEAAIWAGKRLADSKAK